MIVKLKPLDQVLEECNFRKVGKTYENNSIHKMPSIIPCMFDKFSREHEISRINNDLFFIEHYIYSVLWIDKEEFLSEEDFSI